MQNQVISKMYLKIKVAYLTFPLAKVENICSHYPKYTRVKYHKRIV